MSAAEIVTVTLNPAVDQTLQVPGLQLGQINQAHSLRFDAGGKGVNVASVLADLGQACAVTGLLGEDNARIFENQFAARGIADHFIRTPGATRINVKLNDAQSGHTTDINLIASAPAADALVLLRATIAALCAGAARLFVLAGSLPPGVPTDFYATLTRDLKTAGKTVVLDTSGAPFAAALAAAPDLVKPNRHELETWLGRALPDRESVIDGARALRAAGPATVIVSLGEEGALLLSEQGCWLACPPKVNVVSTVGAGDAMVAGWIAATQQGLTPDQSLRLATASAAARISHPDGSLHRAGLTALAAQVDVQVIGF
ncbi:MAG: 1-phosphofructokinase [Formivibrio sp.]|nr:1-phosphofructokinase [Formivibrio sp.]